MKDQKKIIKKIGNKLKLIGLSKGDNIFCHSRLSLFSFINQKNINSFCQVFFKAFLNVIGNEGTIVVPTFSYSFSNNNTYDPKNTPSNCGVFSEYLRSKKDFTTYPDPNVSVSIYGKNAKWLSRYENKNAYGRNSFFDKFDKLNGKILNISLGPTSTFIHYYERQYGIDYRYDKKFFGYVKNHSKLKRDYSIIFVRKKKNHFIQDINQFEKEYTMSGKYKVIDYDNGFFGLTDLKSYKKFIFKKLSKNKNYLIKKK